MALTVGVCSRILKNVVEVPEEADPPVFIACFSLEILKFLSPGIIKWAHRAAALQPSSGECLPPILNKLHYSTKNLWIPDLRRTLGRRSCRATPVHTFIIFSKDCIKLLAAFQSVCDQDRVQLILSLSPPCQL